MSNQDHKAEVSAGRPVPVTREQFERERLTRRGLLRRLGLTAGASLFSLVAIDDVVRATVAKMRETEALHGVADTVAMEFKNAGVAFAQGSPAQHFCGVTPVPCYTCPGGTDGNPPPPGCTDGPCRHCPPLANCDDCFAIAEYRWCNCMQSLANSHPECFDANGNYNGCPQLAVGVGLCDKQRTDEESAC